MKIQVASRSGGLQSELFSAILKAMKTLTAHPKVLKTMETAAKRRARLRALKTSGLSYQKIADKEGCSRQRIQQILKMETSK